ncbi:class I SAM-dependent methyltransferase [Streptomyces sp. ICN441]|uniref:SAM-dependent methyltransferase n=1 Tax=Streptomyces tirandamycinicus TaxID=2174846 RepID=A0A2S1SZJ5_9ACTN|nr:MULTISPECIES: class I SAM-dependent methyltransferase [Streptomyces]AWI31830.1 SAM-dependent methyltransferase [Streptomyces tirandamycinicus]NNJ07239.1 class I SAM-dependent methyltransferase [Streptomyces sp. PKU-MA01144]TFE49840.1 class I SAM-dependent methyltransferase [Streptomyces sp. ICN441]
MSITAIADPTKPGSLAHRARTRRWAELLRCFPNLADMRVLDLGGTPHAWRLSPVRPAHVVTVNLDPSTAHQTEPDITPLVADACTLLTSGHLAGERFDLAYSNSLMEHVGGHRHRQQFAETVHSCADHHWIQTPYRYFPVEPHWLFPGMQWLPFRARVAVSQHWPYGHISSANRPQATQDVEEVELLSVTEMRSYFPQSHIWFERFAGLPKSLVARK